MAALHPTRHQQHGGLDLAAGPPQLSGALLLLLSGGCTLPAELGDPRGLPEAVQAGSGRGGGRAPLESQSCPAPG